MQSLLETHLGENRRIRDHFTDAFGEDGILKERLDEELGEDGEKIQAALNPDKQTTPTYRLKRTILDEIQELRDDLVDEAVRSEVRSQTHFSGEEFEDDLEEIFGEAFIRTSNTIEYTEDIEGEFEGRDVGDFVITLGDTNQRLVVEAKTEYYSKSDIQSKMEDALVNRNADYGLFVTNSLENIPKTKVGMFNEFPHESYVTIALGEGADQDPEPGYLRIAFNWTRMRAIQARSGLGDALDPDELQAQLNDVEDSIGRFSQIRGHCTEIQKSRNRIDEELNSIEQDVTSRLAELTAELHKAE